MIILSKIVNAGTCQSVYPHTITNCAGYNIGRKGTMLYDMDDIIVHDVNNIKIKCVEDWKAPACCEKFLASMSKLHKNHNREGPFQPSCDNCYKTYFIDDLKTGCTYHRYNPHLLNGGNPLNAMVVEESLKNI